MAYIKVTPQLNLTSEQRAEAISRELFRIQRPIDQQGDATAYIFGWHKFANGGSDVKYLPSIVDTCLDVNVNQIIYVHPENDLTNLIALFPELSEEEKMMLAGFIDSQSQFPFGYIIPSGFGVFTYEEMKQDGWFVETEMI